MLKLSHTKTVTAASHLNNRETKRELKVYNNNRFFVGLAGLGIRTSEWTNHKWNMEYCENASRLRVFVAETGARPVGIGLSRAT